MDKIERIIKKHSLYNIYQSSYLCFIAKKIIKEITDIEVKKIKYQNKTIKIEILDPFLVTQIRNKNHLIIEAINQKIGRKKIEKISIT